MAMHFVHQCHCFSLLNVMILGYIFSERSVSGIVLVQSKGTGVMWKWGPPKLGTLGPHYHGKMGTRIPILGDPRCHRLFGTPVKFPMTPGPHFHGPSHVENGDPNAGHAHWLERSVWLWLVFLLQHYSLLPMQALRLQLHVHVMTLYAWILAFPGPSTSLFC